MAREAATKAGLADRVTFEVAAAKAFPGKDYDFIAFFDCLHDMGDPVGASVHVRSALKADGTWMIVEPYAEDATEANHNPIGRIFYSASTLLCVPASILCTRSTRERRPKKSFSNTLRWHSPTSTQRSATTYSTEVRLTTT
jgi:hypothetical protein